MEQANYNCVRVHAEDNLFWVLAVLSDLFAEQVLTENEYHSSIISLEE